MMMMTKQTKTKREKRWVTMCIPARDERSASSYFAYDTQSCTSVECASSREAEELCAKKNDAERKSAN